MKRRKEALENNPNKIKNKTLDPKKAAIQAAMQRVAEKRKSHAKNESKS